MSAASIRRLTVTLDHVKPKVVRKLEVPADLTLERLHLTLQAAFGWHNCHLFEIRCGDLSWGIPQPEFGFDTMRDASKVRLGDVLEEFGAKRLRYTYDFGDNWEHSIAVGKAIDPESDVFYPRLVHAEGRCPPEDVGGPWGFDDILKGLKDPNHAQHKEFVEWYGDADLDPEHFDPEYLQFCVMELALRWAGKRAAKIIKAAGLSAREASATKPARKPPAARKAAAKPAKKAKKAPAKKTGSKKALTKKTGAKKRPVKKTGAKKAGSGKPTRKLPAKKAAAKKKVPAGRKSVAKKRPAAKKGRRS